MLFARWKIDAMLWYKSYLYNKGAKGILNRNSKSKWKALFLLIGSIAKHCKGDYFLSYGIAHMFIGLIFAVR